MEYKKIEEICINHMSLDYMPLHDIVREFTRENQRPSETIFFEAMGFLERFLSKNNVKYMEGPEMKTIQLNSLEFISLLKRYWREDSYDNFNYKFWFEIEN